MRNRTLDVRTLGISTRFCEPGDAIAREGAKHGSDANLRIRKITGFTDSRA